MLQLPRFLTKAVHTFHNENLLHIKDSYKVQLVLQDINMIYKNRGRSPSNNPFVRAFLCMM